jgi:FAD/FMN-containing dehydrogenase
MDRNALFDRPYGDWAKMAYARLPQYALKLKQIKNEMDPQGILNPGKLCF